jgi:predicted nucleic acid-binding Zn ribbon protein
MSDVPMGACPNCGGEGRRVIFPAGIVFKGTGFYKTDSRTAGGGSESSAPAKSSATQKETPSKSASDGASAPAKPAASSSSSES